MVILSVFSLCCIVPISGLAQDQDSSPKKIKIQVDEAINGPFWDTNAPPPPLPCVGDKYYGPVEKIPKFHACEGKNLSISKLYECIGKEISCSIYDNLGYSNDTINKGIKGIVVVQFVLEDDGNIQVVKIVRGVEESLDSAVIKVMKNMRFEMTSIPVRRRRGSSKNQFTIPIKFGY